MRVLLVLLLLTLTIGGCAPTPSPTPEPRYERKAVVVAVSSSQLPSLNQPLAEGWEVERADRITDTLLIYVLRRRVVVG